MQHLHKLRHLHKKVRPHHVISGLADTNLYDHELNRKAPFQCADKVPAAWPPPGLPARWELQIGELMYR